jgi:hypothetical protein
MNAISKPLASDPDVAAAQQAFFADVGQKATQALGQIGNVSVTPIQTAGEVFNYNYLFGSNFVRSTYNLLNTTAVPGSVPGSVGLGGSFVGTYLSLLQQISWVLSPTDGTTVATAQGAASSALNSLVAAYQGLYGPITAAQMTAAGVTTTIDYIIDYQVRQVWSGTLSAKKPPLNLTSGVRNLQAMLPNMPTSGQALLSPLSGYINAMETAWPILNAQSAANWAVSTMIANLQTPPATFQTWDPTQPTAPALPAPAFTTSPSAAQLANDLAPPITGNLVIDADASQSESSTLHVTFDASGGGLIPIDWFVLGVNASTQFNLFSNKGTGTSASVQLTFPNPTLVNVSPQPWDASSGLGWYSAGLIQQAAGNTGGTTGYAFRGAPPALNLAVGGNFGRFAGLAVSQMPTIVITYETGNHSEFEQSFQEQSSWSLSFLGIPLGHASQSVYQAQSKKINESGGFALTFSPPSQAGLASYDLYGFIIGGAVVYPGAQDV